MISTASLWKVNSLNHDYPFAEPCSLCSFTASMESGAEMLLQHISNYRHMLDILRLFFEGNIRNLTCVFTIKIRRVTMKWDYFRAVRFWRKRLKFSLKTFWLELAKEISRRLFVIEKNLLPLKKRNIKKYTGL